MRMCNIHKITVFKLGVFAICDSFSGTWDVTHCAVCQKRVRERSHVCAYVTMLVKHVTNYVTHSCDT